VDAVYQAVLLHAPWHGFADFLRRVDRPSASEAFSYEAVDTKLAHEDVPPHDRSANDPNGAFTNVDTADVAEAFAT
jgi:hypothetical protein